MMKKLLALIPLISFIAIVIFVLFPGLFPPPGYMMFGDDIDRLSYFYKQFFLREVNGGSIPFWNPYLFSGIPYASAFHSGLWYPLHWLFMSIPLQYAFAWYFALHMVLAMLFMYGLCRLWVGKLPAWIGGVVYGLSGPFAAALWAGHFDAVAAMAYIPLVFLFYVRATSRPSGVSTVLLAGTIALQFFAGYPVLALFTAEALGISAIILCIAKRSVRPLFTLAIAWSLGMGIVAIQYIPNSDYVSRTVRSFPIPYGWLAIGALEPQHLLEFIDPFVWGDQNTYFGPWQFYHERIGYFGKIPLVLAITVALIGVWKYRRFGPYWIFLAVATFGVWVSMAFQAPYDLNGFLWKHVSMYQAIRIPTRHLILFVFGSSVLVGFAADIIRRKSILIVVAILVLVDLVPFAKHFVSVKTMPELRHDAALIKEIGSSKELVRYMPNFNIGAIPRDSLDFAAAPYYQLFSVTGYDPSMLRNYYEFIEALNQKIEPEITTYDVQVPYLDVSSPFVNFLNVKYILVPIWQDTVANDQSGRFTLLREDPSHFFRLYQNNRALPRFYFVPKITLYPSREEVAGAIRSREPNVANTVLVNASSMPRDATHDPDCQGEVRPTVAVTSYASNRIELTTSGACNAYLTSSEVYYPAWKASIDGTEVPILESNLAFRTIYIPRGSHQVVYRYDPEAFTRGGIISLISLGLCLFWVTAERVWKK